MKMKIRNVLCLCLCLLFLLPVQAFAAEETQTGEVNAVFSDYGRTLTLSGTGMLDYDGDFSQNTNVEVLIVEDGFTSIGMHFASRFPNVRKVRLPGTIENYPNYLFSDHEKLETVELGEGIRTMDAYAFCDCTSLKRIEFPHSFEYLGVHGLKNCPALEEIVFHEGMKTIASYCASNCASLKTVVLPDSLETISNYAFMENPSLTEITLPRGLKKLGNYAFMKCGALTTLTVNCEAVERGSFFFLESPIRNVVFGESVRKIPSYFLKHATSNVQSLTIAEGVQSIGSCALQGLPQDVIVHIPSTVTTMNRCAFTSPICAVDRDGEAYRFAAQEQIPFAVCGQEPVIPPLPEDLDVPQEPDETEKVVTVRFARCNAKAGDIVEIPVELTRNDGMAALQIDVKFDSEALTLLEVRNGDVFGDDEMVVSGELSASPVRILWMDAQTRDNTATGTLAVLRFAVSQTVKPDTMALISTVGTQAYDEDLSMVTVTRYIGYVHVPDAVGDVDADGELTLRDVALVQRTIVGGWGVTVDVSAADMNGDWVLDARDVVLLTRRVAGWD